MIGIVSSFLLGFTLIKGGLPWWVLISAMVVIITVDSVFGTGADAHSDDLDH